LQISYFEYFGSHLSKQCLICKYVNKGSTLPRNTTQHNQSQNRTAATKTVIFAQLELSCGLKQSKFVAACTEALNTPVSRNKRLNASLRRISESTPVSTNISSERTSRYLLPSSTPRNSLLEVFHE